MEVAKLVLLFSVIGNLTLMQFKLSDMNHQLERIANNSVR